MIRRERATATRRRGAAVQGLRRSSPPERAHGLRKGAGLCGVRAVRYRGPPQGQCRVTELEFYGRSMRNVDGTAPALGETCNLNVLALPPFTDPSLGVSVMA